MFGHLEADAAALPGPGRDRLDRLPIPWGGRWRAEGRTQWGLPPWAADRRSQGREAGFVRSTEWLSRNYCGLAKGPTNMNDTIQACFFERRLVKKASGLRGRTVLQPGATSARIVNAATIVACLILNACAETRGPLPAQNALGFAAAECTQGSESACKMVEAATEDAQQRATAAVLPHPTDTRASETATRTTNWWLSITPPENELFIGVTADESSAYWANTKFLETPAGTRIVFVHVEESTPTAPDYSLSVREIMEINCKVNQFRTQQLTGFLNRNLSGSITITEQTSGPWTYIPPGSIDDALQERTCSVATPREKPHRVTMPTIPRGAGLI